MWIVFSLLCMVTLTVADIIGKKAVGADELAPLKLRVIVMTLSAMLGILMYVLQLGESGLTPWRLIAEHPLILAAMCCTVLSEYLYIFSLKYIGMTVMEAVSSLEGIFVLAGLIVISVITGGLSAVREMFTPARLVFILLILICAILLPNIELFANRKTAITGEIKRNRIVPGISIALLAAILSSAESLVADTLLDSGMIGAIDLTMTVYFSQLFPLPVFCFSLAEKSRAVNTSCKIPNRYFVAYTVLDVIYILLGIIAVSYDAVRSEVMFLIYPVIAILGAKIVLKENYTRRQNIRIWIITLSAIGFCMIDYIS